MSARRDTATKATSGLTAPAVPVEPTDLRVWRRARLLRRTRSGLPLSRTSWREATPDELVARAVRRSAAHAFAEGDATRLSAALTGASLPTARLQSLSGHYLPLDDLSVGWLIVYCFPGSHIGSEESHLDDERDHQAYARCYALLERRGVRLASLSSAPSGLQTRALLKHGLMHHIMLDPELLVADALGLPTLCEGGLRGYSRLTLIARGGVIEHVFYPVARGGRSAKQAVTWMRIHGGLDGLSVG